MYNHTRCAIDRWFCAISVLALVAGCGEPLDAETLASLHQSVVTDNGTSINGTSVNGTSVNGTSINGVSVNGTSINGTSINGTSINGTSINGTSVNGTSMSNTDFIGATFVGLTADGGTVPLRIDAMAPEAAPNQDVYEWAVSYYANSSWSPLCGVDGRGAPIRAIPLAGTWNPRTGARTNDGNAFTLACLGASVAKCVGLGYKPWRTVAGQSLDAYHQACVRMIRADYCGDGTSWTVDNRWIDVADALEIQSFATDWHFEAQWSANGATCVARTRVDWKTRGPACLDNLPRRCEDDLRPGALLMDRFERRLVIP